MKHLHVNLLLPLAFAIIGFLTTTRLFLFFLNKQSPFIGLLIYYAFIITSIWLLQRAGLIVAGIKFDNIRHTIGTILIIFSFFMVISWTSCYVNYTVNGQCDVDKISGIYLQSEDGAVYYLWSKITKDPQKLRILTYIITPAILCLLGTMLITEKVAISPF